MKIFLSNTVAILKILGVYFLLIANRAHAAIPAPAGLFSESQVYTDDLFVLSDHLEFSVFDMSRLNLFIHQSEISLKPQDPNDTTQQPELKLTEEQKKTESDVKAILNDLPKNFYQSLKKMVIQEKVPVTLYSQNAPAFAKTIKLYVKLKKIHLAEPYTNKKGERIQTIGLKIYGQLKEKDSDRVLARFYDVETSEYISGKTGLEDALIGLSDKMMRDLALFLRSRY